MTPQPDQEQLTLDEEVESFHDFMLPWRRDRGGRMTDCVYLSGPISLGGTGSPEQIASNIAAFDRAEERLTREGRVVLSPISIPAQTSWEGYMRHALAMVAEADTIRLLPGWEQSRGARLELFVAGELGLSVETEEETPSP